MTRRDLSLLLPALGLLGNRLGDAQTGTSGQSTLSHSAAFSFDQLASRRGASGAVTHPVIQGKLPTGEIVEMHQTTLGPGQMPHAAHKHVHTEFMLIREGAVEFTANGESHQLGPGGVAYAASEEMHGIKNVGAGPANYFVIAIGTQPKHS